jgi:hypothetical protein
MAYYTGTNIQQNNTQNNKKKTSYYIILCRSLNNTSLVAVYLI